MKIRAIDGKEPHEDNGGWENYLKSCEVRDSYDGVIFYGTTNCNYIVFPDGVLICNYGYHGKALMNRIRDNGVEVVKASIMSDFEDIERVLKKLGLSNVALLGAGDGPS